MKFYAWKIMKKKYYCNSLIKLKICLGYWKASVMLSLGSFLSKCLCLPICTKSLFLYLGFCYSWFSKLFFMFYLFDATLPSCLFPWLGVGPKLFQAIVIRFPTYFTMSSLNKESNVLHLTLTWESSIPGLFCLVLFAPSLLWSLIPPFFKAEFNLLHFKGCICIHLKALR